MRELSNNVKVRVKGSSSRSFFPCLRLALSFTLFQFSAVFSSRLSLIFSFSFFFLLGKDVSERVKVKTRTTTSAFYRTYFRERRGEGERMKK